MAEPNELDYCDFCGATLEQDQMGMCDECADQYDEDGEDDSSEPKP